MTGYVIKYDGGTQLWGIFDKSKIGGAALSWHHTQEDAKGALIRMISIGKQHSFQG